MDPGTSGQFGAIAAPPVVVAGSSGHVSVTNPNMAASPVPEMTPNMSIVMNTHAQVRQILFD